ncbi:OB-fold nucleic acid binding domain-containing protein, partial [Patescibacteria group bacterium]|nr:OB-fold nucleic acid binding domain-containing protein [Patescibacteria group bacterium]
MKRTLVEQTLKLVGKKVSLSGWVNRRRDHGKLVFIDLRDRTGIIQVVGGDDLSELKSEDVIELTG